MPTLPVETTAYDYSVLTFIDDTPTTPLEYEVYTLTGSVTVSGFKYYLNESKDLQARGRHLSTIPGQRTYVEATLTFYVDGSYAGSAKDGLIDLIGGTSGGSYASRVLTDANSPIPHLHMYQVATLPNAATAKLALEDCEVTAFNVDDSEGDSQKISLTVRSKGRTFMDGECVAAEYGASRTAPSWLP